MYYLKYRRSLSRYGGAAVLKKLRMVEQVVALARRCRQFNQRSLRTRSA